MALAAKAPGVHRMRVDRERWTITVWYDPGVTDPETLARVLEDAAEKINASEQP